MTAPGAPGTASDGYRTGPAPHTCPAGPDDYGRRPCPCRGSARPRPTLASWSETCDWGHCNGKSYAVRWADDLGLWLPVCRKHRANDVVLFEELPEPLTDAFREGTATALEARGFPALATSLRPVNKPTTEGATA